MYNVIYLLIRFLYYFLIKYVLELAPIVDLLIMNKLHADLEARARRRQENMLRECGVVNNPLRIGKQKKPTRLPPLCVNKEQYKRREVVHQQQRVEGVKKEEEMPTVILNKKNVIIQWAIQNHSNNTMRGKEPTLDLVEERRKQRRQAALQVHTEREPTPEQPQEKRWRVLRECQFYKSCSYCSQPLGMLSTGHELIEKDCVDGWVKFNQGWISHSDPKAQFIPNLREVVQQSAKAISTTLLSELDSITSRVTNLIEAAHQQSHNDAVLDDVMQPPMVSVLQRQFQPKQEYIEILASKIDAFRTTELPSAPPTPPISWKPSFRM